MFVSTLENLLKVMREKLSQQDINHTMILAFDEIIRELKRLDIACHRSRHTAGFSGGVMRRGPFSS
jgi:hypothetical protein